MNYTYDEQYCKAFGIHLKKLRVKKEIGMREFAKLAGMQHSQISKLERGVGNPTISTVLVLANALGVLHSDMYKF